MDKNIYSTLRSIYRETDKTIPPDEFLANLSKKISYFYKGRIIISSLSFIVFFAAFLKSTTNLINYLKSANSWQFIQLLFSDSLVVLKNINVYFLSVLEVLPLTQISLALLFLILWYFSFSMVRECLKSKKVKNLLNAYS